MTRFLLYSHDTYGLGHFRRSSLLAAGLVEADPRHEALIVTGSPLAEGFTLAERIDTVKLPTATKNAAGAYRPRKLGGGLQRLVKLRAHLICSTAVAYEPDVIIVDHAPLGMAGELWPLLTELRRRSRPPRLVLGLRDIIDHPDRVAASWHRDGIWDALGHYDQVYVYGDPAVTTTAQELGLDRRIGASVTHTGYVAPTMPEARTVEPFLLVTPGGGGDGQELLARYLDAVEAGATAGVRSLVVTGPLLGDRGQADVVRRAGRLPDVDVLEFSDRMRSLIASATGVISMAGYNTVVEELAARTPALLVPRHRPRLEQHLRATRLEATTQLRQSSAESLTPRRVRRFVESCRHDPRVATTVDLSGVATVVDALAATTTERIPAHV